MSKHKHRARAVHFPSLGAALLSCSARAQALVHTMAAPPPPPDATQTATLDAQIERLMRCSPLPEPEVKVSEERRRRAMRREVE